MGWCVELLNDVVDTRSGADWMKYFGSSEGREARRCAVFVYKRKSLS